MSSSEDDGSSSSSRSRSNSDETTRSRSNSSTKNESFGEKLLDMFEHLFKPNTRGMEVDPSDPIKHVIVVMLENHSFDNIMGDLTKVYPNLDGLKGEPRLNLDNKGTPYHQNALSVPVEVDDLPHDFRFVQTQLSDSNGGFIRAVEQYKLTPPNSKSAFKDFEDDKKFAMSYFPHKSLEATHTLCEHFRVCDRYFCSVPSSTWPNRLFAMSGTSLGRVDTPADLSSFKDYHIYNQESIFTRMHEKGVSFKVLFHDFPLAFLLKKHWNPLMLEHFHKYTDITEELSKPEGQLPSLIWIEPSYMGDHPTDHHPPHLFVNAELFLAQIYNAVRANKTLWESCAIVYTYDEHGGYYDHVIPPVSVPPDDHKVEYTFDQYGFRVPTVLISPWIDQGLDSNLYDHTSILKYLIYKYHLESLGNRTEVANPLINNLRSTLREDTPKRIVVKDTRTQEQVDREKSFMEFQRQNVCSPGSNEMMTYAVKFADNLEDTGIHLPPQTKTDDTSHLDTWERACTKVKATIEFNKNLV